MSKDYSKLKRPKQAMPGVVKQALKKKGLLEAYKKRPEYQQNDYIDWINDAKFRETKQERLNQMLFELEKGDVFMGVVQPPSEKKD
ncbi:MAG: YdeI/OmpD-associated family protein [Bacillota bacterium]